MAGPPKGNKNAVRTGEYETIWADQLTGEERELYGAIDTDGLVQLVEEIRLTSIRERRMLARIAALNAESMTVTEMSSETGVGPEGPFDRTTEKSEGTLGQIQRIEEALTRVQATKAKLIELWHKLSDSDDDGTVDELIAALQASRRKRAEHDAV